MTPYYQDDAVTIYHGDSHDLMGTLWREGVRVDLLLTDPPFFMPAQHYAARREWVKSWGDTSILGSWFAASVERAIPMMRRHAHFFTFCDDESYPVFYPELYRRFDTLNALVWDKGRIGMGTPWRHAHELIIGARWSDSAWHGSGGTSDVLRFDPVPSAVRTHPVDKPEALLRHLIGPTTTTGQLVLDPFMGGGSTIYAAKQAGRKAIGIEIEERYCEIAAKRCAQEVLELSA